MQNIKQQTTPSKEFQVIKRYKIIVITLTVVLSLLVFVIIGVLLMYFDSKNKADLALQNNENTINLQKKQKDEIRNIWEEQTSRNDDLSETQIKLTNRIEIYQKILLDAFTIVGNKLEKKSDVNISTFKKVEEDMINALKEINVQIDENARLKELDKDKIDKMYIEADEDQKNRINYLDGIR
jgi:uncharacterized membrane protein YraQ (UPF0718 family)